MKNMQVLHDESWKKISRFSKLLILFLLMSVPCVYAQNRPNNGANQGKVITGTVTDAEGEPLIGVSVSIKGTTIGIMTDIDGSYSLDVQKPNSVLVFTYMGYETQEVQIGDRKEISIVMKSRITDLDEVVLIGYGVQKKKLVTGATLQVKGDDISKLNTVNTLGALQSQTPGVNIVQSSGMPGEPFKVTIRGIGTNGDSSPLYIIDGSPGGDISTLNPSDIESVDVLKDAASAAIYGSRAANGIIMVTTKTGKKGKPQITFDGYFGVQNIYRMPDILNAQEYVTIMNESRLMDNLPAYDFAKDVPAWADIASGKWQGTNWLELGRNKDAPTQNYSIGISGGTEQSVYSTGFAYTSQEGIIGVPVPKYERYTVRINSEHTVYKSGNLDIIKLGQNLTYSFIENNGVAIGDMWYNDVRNMIKTNPLLPNLDDTGNYHYAIPWESRTANPIAQMEYRSQSATKNHNLKANAFLTIQPIKGLILKSNFGFTLNAGSYRSYSPKYDLSTSVKNTLESVSQSMWTGMAYTLENTATYNTTLEEKHNISALLGQSIEKSGMGDNLNAANGNPLFHNLKHAYVSNAPLTELNGATAMGGSPWTPGRMASFFGRVNYDFDNKYMFTAIMRADASSRFAKGHRWGYFPSVSAGWVMSSEPFMQPIASTIDFLKLRASWGQNGNQAIPAFKYLATIAYSGNYGFGNDKTKPSLGAYPEILPNVDITWETSEQTNIGADARFINSRLGLALDYYIKTTKDWLVAPAQLASFGTELPATINGGKIRNNGVEVALTWNDRAGDFSYGANVNFAHNKNKVLEIANDEGIIRPSYDDIIFQGATEIYRAQVGYPIGYFYGYKTAGVFQTQQQVNEYKGAKLADAREGDVIWVDRDGDGEITENDRGMIGNPHPDFTLGLGFNASYKGFDISLTMYGAFGQQIMKSYRSWSDFPKDNHTSEVFGRWHGEGTSNRLPRLTTNSHSNWRYVSDLYVEDGDYLRMQNITLGYDFKRLFPKMFLQQARVYVTAQNLFTITGYSGMDPEVGYSAGDSWASGIDTGFYPTPRTYIVGVNLKF